MIHHVLTAKAGAYVAYGPFRPGETYAGAAPLVEPLPSAVLPSSASSGFLALAFFFALGFIPDFKAFAAASKGTRESWENR